MSQSEELAIHACDRERVHIPGTIQPHGYLFVLDGENLEIVQCSNNISEILGIEPENSIGTSFIEKIDQSARSELISLLEDAGSSFSNPLQVPLNIDGRLLVFDGIAHRSGDNIVVELENPGTRTATNLVTSRSLDHYFALTTRTLNRLDLLENAAEAAHLICDEIRAFTGFDRVMFYEFAPDDHGFVVAESQTGKFESFKGLHYPATDIPKQARELYAKNWLRLIHDVAARPIGLTPQDRNLDMSHCALRSVSPIHIQYLKNMGVASSMSISLVDRGRLWALIACHHYDGPLFVPYSSRVSCVHFGIVIGSRLLAFQQRAQTVEVEHRKNVLTQTTKDLPEHSELFGAVLSRASDWRELLGADGVAIVHRNSLQSDGSVPDRAFIDRLLEKLETTSESDFFISERLGEDLPDLEAIPPEATGVIAIGLGVRSHILFFRIEDPEVVRWAGNPDKATNPAEPLTPRSSFEEWKETVRGSARSWTKADREIARELRSGLTGLFIQHNYQLERLNRELARKNEEIEQFTYSVSHDLKSPLFTINGFVSALREDLEKGDSESVDHCLSRITGLTSRMGLLIDDLLDFSRIGRVTSEMEFIDINELLGELKEDIASKLERSGATLEIAPHLPRIRGYEEVIYRAFLNLVENAIKYGPDNGDLLIQIDAVETPEAVRFRVRDNGPGIDPRYHDKIFELFQRLDTKHSGTGLGLASVAKIAAMHSGECGVESEPGAGSVFWIQIPS